MPKKTKETKANKYREYLTNLGNTGTFYKDSKDKKGTEGILVSIAKDGVYAKVGKSPFPVMFERADFGTSTKLKCPKCGTKLKLVVDNGKDSKESKSKKGDKADYGKFGKNVSAKNFIKMWEELQDLDSEDDDDYKKGVELFKKALKK